MLIAIINLFVLSVVLIKLTTISKDQHFDLNYNELQTNVLMYSEK